MDGFDLGTHSRRVSTRSPEAQRWFDIGLNWCYGFNHEEGIRCFEKALGFDPGGAMAHWGIAYASGPFYNLTWKEHGAAEAEKATKRCFEHVQLAKEAAGGASPVERRLIEALTASAASSYVCLGDDAAESFVVGVVVAPDDVPADHADLLVAAGVVGAVQRDVPQRRELRLYAV